MSDSPSADVRYDRRKLFDDVVGQRALTERLAALLASRDGQFFIFAGSAGQGKKTLARRFAKGLLAEAAVDPDTAVRWFDAGTHPDYRELLPESPGKVIPVEQVRRQVVGDIGMLPQAGRLKVYLIEADALNESGQNALLKTLEEPEAYGVFLLTVSQRERLLDTVLSRGTLLKLTAHSDAEVLEILKRRCTAEPAVLAAAARHAGGCPGVAIRLADSEWFASCGAELSELMALLQTGSRTAVLQRGMQWFEANRDQTDLLLDMLEMRCRDLMLCIGGEMTAAQLISPEDAESLRAAASAFRGDLTRMAKAAAVISEVRTARRYNGNFEIGMTHLLVRLQKELYNA